jgi:undecaprenyl diphosphate synthase
MSRAKKRRGIHLGIIPDGSRRWARMHKVKKGDWSQSGKTTDDIVTHVLMQHPEVEELSIWAMSTENVDRDDYSRNLVYSLLEGKFLDLLESPIVKQKGVKVNVVGSRLADVPQNVKELVDKVVSKTKGHKAERVLNICLGYGGKQEILDAVMASSKWLRKNPTIAKIHENVFEHFLMVPRSLDVVIRTGGEKRLSGFMLYQIEYAELFFTDTLWPAFTTKELDSILDEFSKRDRRYGK